MKLRITLEGKTYEVDVEFVQEPQAPPPPPLPIIPRTITPPPPRFARGGRVPGSDEKTCRSPLAGVVASIIVVPGQTVEKNAPLVVVEAMKMETRLVSVAAGTIKTIQVAPGDPVKPGQVLIEFE